LSHVASHVMPQDSASVQSESWFRQLIHGYRQCCLKKTVLLFYKNSLINAFVGFKSWCSLAVAPTCNRPILITRVIVRRCRVTCSSSTSPSTPHIAKLVPFGSALLPLVRGVRWSAHSTSEACHPLVARHPKLHPAIPGGRGGSAAAAISTWIGETRPHPPPAARGSADPA
jgi:hypothetical protein